MSVIIPCLDGDPFVTPLFAALRAQTAPSPAFEVIIVDNGSREGLARAMAAEARDISNLRVLTFTDRQSSYAARNFGVEHSAGRVLAFMDMDCRPPATWVAHLLAPGAIGDREIVAGRVVLFPRGACFTPVELLDRCWFFRHDIMARRRVGTTACLAVSRALFDELGGFREWVSGADADFCRRATAVGAHVVARPEWEVAHPARATHAAMREKLARVARGYAQSWQALPGPGRRGVALLGHVGKALVLSQLWRALDEARRVERFSPRSLAVFAGVAAYHTLIFHALSLHRLGVLAVRGPAGAGAAGPPGRCRRGCDPRGPARS